jgi:hypothetical protein
VPKPRAAVPLEGPVPSATGRMTPVIAGFGAGVAAGVAGRKVVLWLVARVLSRVRRENAAG